MLKALISGYYGFKNFGDEAILGVLVEHLKSLNVDVTVLSKDVKFTENTYNVFAINSFDFKKLFTTLTHSDVLISGGGSLLQDVTSIKSLMYYSAVIALAILLGKKVIIFAQGIGPINNKFAQIIVKNLLKFCSLITVRDTNSLKTLENWGIRAKLVCDPIYSLQTKITDKENSIGVQLRDFKTMNYNLLQKLAMFLNVKFPDKKVKIFSLQEALDLDVSRKFESILKSLNPDMDIEIITENIINNIAKLEHLVAMRFHAILVALKYGVKTCAINYDIKVEQLAKDASIPFISMDAHENFEEIYQNTQKLDSEKLSSFANSKDFDWSDFDELFITLTK